MTNALRVWLLSDGVPGHVNQARGLLYWMAKQRELDVEEVSVRLRAGTLSRQILTVWIERSMDHVRGLKWAYAIDYPVEPPDLIVSAGGNTAFANVLLQRRFEVPNVFIGSGRRLSGKIFSAHLTLEPTGGSTNVVMTLSPSNIDALAVAEAGRTWRQETISSNRPLFCMACGGNGAGVRYRVRDWTRLGIWMSRIASELDIRWLVSTSRRTTSTGESALRAAIADSALAYAIWWHQRPEPIFQTLLGAADCNFVTHDSMSMINECISAEKPLVVVQGGRGGPDTRYTNVLNKFTQLGFCVRIQVDAGLEGVPEMSVPARDYHNALAEDVLRRLSIS